jgi:hypothetical protein
MDTHAELLGTDQPLMPRRQLGLAVRKGPPSRRRDISQRKIATCQAVG